MRVVAEVGLQSAELVVVGGLVPEYLTQETAELHQGTADVDIVLSVGFVYDRDDQDFRWLEEALHRTGFTPDVITGGWRWRTELNGFIVKMKFLCDIPGDMSNSPVPLPGCDVLAAKNLQGPGPAISDTMPVELTPSAHGAPVTVHVAGLGGYVLAKAAAAAGRGEDRDFYDLVFVLLFNDAGGPTAAAVAVKECAARMVDPVDSYRTVYLPRLHQALDAVALDPRHGASSYARIRQQLGADDDLNVLVEDAVSAAVEFRETLMGSNGRR